MMNVLAVYAGHNATAALLVDGAVVGVVSEERFTRRKNQGGFPVLAVKWLLKEYDLRPKDLDVVGVCGTKIMLAADTLEGKASGKRRVVKDLLTKAYGFAEYRSGRLYAPLFMAKSLAIDLGLDKALRQFSIDTLKKEFGFSEDRIRFVEHHDCHAYSAYFGQTEKKEKAAVLTLDGEGDDLCATVSIAEGDSIRRISSTFKYHSLGYVYSITTAFMGMTPLEHEYKVMGLAPYASTKEKKYYLKTYDKVFKGLIWLDRKDPLSFRSKFPTNRFYYWLKENAVGERFDNLAGALQFFTEDLVTQWVRNVVKKTRISNLYCGGGVFMNVKMNMMIAQMPEVKSLKVLPSCGDESTPIGAAYYLYMQLCKEQKKAPDTKRIKGLYLGPGYDQDVEPYIKKKGLEKKYIVRKANPTMIAGLLAKGEIIARSVGRMEWGARSLGNRCIMANPSDLKFVWQINEQIKMRDFWMPFAPSILKESAGKYIENPKGIEAPYMILAFNSKPLGRTELRAAMHQADYTLRPQLVEEDWNPKYYAIIKEFERMTGIGGILNTSFNLHGKPIVGTPKDAVEEVFEHSGLNHLLLGDFLISKKS